MADINGTYNPLSPVYLNQNPLDIEDPNWDSWFDFQKYMLSINPALPNELKINRTAGRNVTKEYIRDYNSLPTTPANKRITINNIEAVQKFNSGSDPSVVVDGWVGTQTAKLTYPIITVFVLTNGRLNNPTYRNFGYNPNKPPNEPISNESSKYAPVHWGNKRYILDYKTIYDIWKQNQNIVKDQSSGNNPLQIQNLSVPFEKLLLFEGINQTNAQTDTGLYTNSFSPLWNTQLQYWKGSPYKRYNPSTTLYETAYFDWGDPYFTKPQPPKPGMWPPESIANKTPTKINKETEEEQKRNDSQKQGTQTVNGITQPPR